MSPSKSSSALGGAWVAAASKDTSDNLEPGIKNCNQATQPKPLKRVTIMLFYAAAYYWPVAQEAITGRIGLHYGQRREGQAHLARKAVGVEILPDA